MLIERGRQSRLDPEEQGMIVQHADEYAHDSIDIPLPGENDL